MTTSTQAVSLEPTASLVMDWALPLYQKQPVLREFSKHFDLSSGEDLRQRIDQIAPFAGSLVRNRKFWFEKQIGAILANSKVPSQIVILAAGKSPLALQCWLNHGNKIEAIYEVDSSSLEDKLSIYTDLDLPNSPSIFALQKNITDDDLVEELSQLGYQVDRPTIISMEGIVYYILPEQLRAILTQFQAKTSGAEILLDSKVEQPANVTGNGLGIEKVFEIIKESCQLDFITSYQTESLKETLATIVNHWQCHSQRDIEKIRTGSNQYFLPESEDSIDFVSCKLA